MPGPIFLNGETITLRTVERDDLAFFQQLINDPDVWPGFGAPDPRNRVAQERRFEELGEQDDEIELLICRNETPVGRIRLTHINEAWGTAELVCSVTPDEQNRGYATESSRLLVGHAFDSLRLNKLVVRVFATNQPSQRVVEKLGFVREGTLRQQVYSNSEYIDLYCYGLLESEWRSDDSDPSEMDRDEIHEILDAVSEEIDSDTVDRAILAAEEDVAETVFGSESDTE